MLYICTCTKLAFQLRYFLDLAYKGTNYHGWQYQPNAISIQEIVTKALSTILRTKIEIVGAGRTDTGVHAQQIMAHFDYENVILKPNFLYNLNAILPNDIVVNNIFKVKINAHARFDAVKRSYEYKILLGRNPFFIDTTWQLINKKLNVAKMNEASEILLTYTNFKSFSRSKTDVKTFDCKIYEAVWTQEGKWLIFKISADRFLRNMVRAIVGTLLAVGEEKISIDCFKKIIESKNRAKAGASAPPQGLFLTEIKYPKSIFLNE